MPARPRFPALQILTITCSLLLAGCSEHPEAREVRVLRQANESLRQQLLSSEQALAQAHADLEALKTQNTPSGIPAPALTASTPPVTEPTAPETTITETTGQTDTTYIVVSKHFVAGQLVPQPSGSDPTAAKRIPPVYQITFRGEQSSRLYPALNVSELAFPRFREGQSYSRAALNAAKPVNSRPVPIATNHGGNTTEPPIDFDSIFGSP